MFQNITLHHIRPYLHARAEFDSGINVLFGPNGAGKTTLLESMYVVATTRSYRASKLFDLVSHEHLMGEIQAETKDLDTLKVEVQRTKHIFTKNGSRVSRTSQFLHSIRVVVLAPEHQELISGSAEKRRLFVDHLLCQKNPLLLDLFKTYRKTLKQKQALLRHNVSFTQYKDLVEPWNEKLVESGERIRAERKNLLESLVPLIQEEYGYISQNTDFASWIYKEHESSMVEGLEQLGFQEHRIRRALVGPHRDDLQILLRNQSAAHTASQGERASLLLAIKFSEMTFLATPTFPTLLLDDVGVTLDQDRRKCLFERLEKLQPQTIITTPDAGILANAKSLNATVLTREKGDLSNQIFWKSSRGKH